MNANLPSDTALSADSAHMSRREAIRRAALLLGVACSPALLDGALRAQTPAVGPRAAKPVYLNATQFATAGTVAERILPRTDTPGALDVGVPAFIDLMYGKFFTEVEQTAFVAGLAGVETSSTSAHKTGFAALAADQQDALLLKLAKGSAKDQAFFRQIKEVTVLGYFTSETVGKTVLHYDPVPGRFDACVPLAEVGNRAWTK